MIANRLNLNRLHLARIGSGNVQATLVCEVFRENASVYTLTYFFVVRDPQLFRNGFE